MADVKEYSPRLVTLSWGPVLIDSGFADGSFVEPELDEDEVNATSGADGSVMLVENLSRLFTVTITLQQTSPINAAISAIVKAGQLAKIRPVLPFYMNDRGGTTIIAAEKCWLKKRAGAPMAKEGSNRAWVFQGLWDEWFVGGN
jgi:hypothetical protein